MEGNLELCLDNQLELCLDNDPEPNWKKKKKPDHLQGEPDIQTG